MIIKKSIKDISRNDLKKFQFIIYLFYLFYVIYFLVNNLVKNNYLSLLYMNYNDFKLSKIIIIKLNNII